MDNPRTLSPGPAMPLASDPAAVTREKWPTLPHSLGLSRRDAPPSSPAIVTTETEIKRLPNYHHVVVHHFKSIDDAQAFRDFCEKASVVWAALHPRDVVTFPHGRPGFACINQPPKTEF